MQQPAKALTLDGHGVVYYRTVEVPDVVAKQLAEEWNLPLSPTEVRNLYLSLQEEAFAETLPYPDMLLPANRRACARQGRVRRFAD